MADDKQCRQCGISFHRGESVCHSAWAKRVYCSQRCVCHNMHERRRQLPRRKYESKTCIQCGNAFTRTGKDTQKLWDRRKCCSRDCKHALMRANSHMNEPKYCEGCGNRIHYNYRLTRKDWSKVRFCSRACADARPSPLASIKPSPQCVQASIAALKGKHSSKRGKTWDELYGTERASVMRANKSAAHKGKPSPLRGSITSFETRRKQSLIRIAKYGGEKAPNWKGNQSSRAKRQRHMDTFEYREWRRAVFERDNYTCTGCGVKGEQLHAHHIKPYATHPELRTIVSNGITWCKQCHNIYHNKNGRHPKKYDTLKVRDDR